MTPDDPMRVDSPESDLTFAEERTERLRARGYQFLSVEEDEEEPAPSEDDDALQEALEWPDEMFDDKPQVHNYPGKLTDDCDSAMQIMESMRLHADEIARLGKDISVMDQFHNIFTTAK